MPTAVYSGDGNFTGSPSPADTHTVNILPSITGISPTFGPMAGSTSVTIDGLNLADALAVDFGPMAGTIVTDTPTQIVAISPPGAMGLGHVTVQTADGLSGTSTADGFTYLAPMVDTTVPKTYQCVEGNWTGNLVVATFTDANPGSVPADFSGMIDWGDGHSASFTSFAVGLSDGTFNVRASYTYADEGTYHVTVTTNDSYGQSVRATNTTFAVADAPLTDTTPATLYHVTADRSTGNQVLATFSDGNPGAQAGDFTPTVSWGGGVIGNPSLLSVQLLSRTTTDSNWEVLGMQCMRPRAFMPSAFPYTMSAAARWPAAAR